MKEKDYRPRLVDEQVDFYLSTFGAVCLEGPKWCGKTRTCLRHAKSAFMLDDPADNFANRELARIDVGQALAGETPHLIDEWQEVPSVWDAVRHAVDESTEPGRWLLTGSATPLRDKTAHSGTGRIGRLRMRTMSLFESGDSTGEVSLSEVCSGGDVGVRRVRRPELDEIVALVLRGGWPGVLGKSLDQARAVAREYIENVIESDINRLDDVVRDPAKVRKCLRSLARNESTTASDETIRGDTGADDGSALSINTVATYLGAFRRLHLLDDMEPFSPFLRSPARIKQASKRHLCDPSLAASLLGATPKMLLRDLRTFGFLFEALAERDLRVYADALGAGLYHYQDYADREIDAVIQFPDGAWSAFEVKLGMAQVDEAAAKLVDLASAFSKNPPRSLAVVVGLAGAAYRRPDGVYVLPLTALRPK